MLKKIRVKYKGICQIMHRFPGFDSDVNPGDEIEVPESIIAEYSGHDDWEIVKEKVEKKTKKGDDE